MQPGLDAWRATVCCGTNFVARARALYGVGYFPTVSITEDFVLSVRLATAGHYVRFHAAVVSTGEAPEDLKQIFKQRRRWCCGCWQVFLHPDTPAMIAELARARGVLVRREIDFDPAGTAHERLFTYGGTGDDVFPDGCRRVFPTDQTGNAMTPESRRIALHQDASVEKFDATSGHARDDARLGQRKRHTDGCGGIRQRILRMFAQPRTRDDDVRGRDEQRKLDEKTDHVPSFPSEPGTPPLRRLSARV